MDENNNNKKNRKPSSTIGKWFRETVSFIMESVFMWPEKVCKEILGADYDAEESEEEQKRKKREWERDHWALEDDDSDWDGSNLGKAFTFDTSHQIKEGEEIQKPIYYEGKDSRENVFRRKMKGKEGKLIQLKKGVSVGIGDEEYVSLEKGVVLLYLGLCGLQKEKVDDEYVVFIGLPTWLWGDKKFYGWIPAHHFSIVGQPKKDLSFLKKYKGKKGVE